MDTHVKILLLTPLAIACVSGCDAYEKKRKRDEAIASLRTLREQQDVGGGPIRLRVSPEAIGRDNLNPNGEYVTLSNSSSVPVEIGGWTLCQGASTCYSFPHGAAIPPNGEIRLHSGSGTATATAFYMGHERAVWDNDHDMATLRHGETVVAQDVY